jgi:hypothetical protein
MTAPFGEEQVLLLRDLLQCYADEAFAPTSSEKRKTITIFDIGNPKPRWCRPLGDSHVVGKCTRSTVRLPFAEARDVFRENDWRMAVTSDGTLVVYRNELRHGKHTETTESVPITRWGRTVKKQWQVMPFEWLHVDEIRSYVKQLQLHFANQPSSQACAS